MTIPIVQGVAVADPSAKQSAPGTYYQNPMAEPLAGAGGDYVGGQPQQYQGMQHAKQPNQFRDVFWAVLFILHFIPLVLYAMYSSIQQEGGENAISIGPHIYWISVVALVSVGLSTFSLEGMMRHAAVLVKMSLIFSVFFSLLIGVWGILTGQILMTIVGFFSFAIGMCYAWAVWSRIPYAASVLRTALTAVRLNMGLVLVAYVFMALGFAFSILFFLGFGNAIQQASYPVLFCWLVSFYWVHQVLQYTVHVICAGVVATWWFNPLEAAGCFSSALRDSLVRALTYSFGSICFGAFIVAVVRALRVTLQTARNNDDAQFLVCILECILRCIEDFIDYLNRWAYVYIGIYGFGYLDAGREVITLFQNRGWSVIISDDLVDNVLFMISVSIGLIAGLLGYFVGKEALANTGVEEPGMVAFGYGFLLGLILSTIALGVVGSAVNTVIVCFCEAPAEFERNHPQLSAEMRSAWVGAWPELSLN